MSATGDLIAFVRGLDPQRLPPRVMDQAVQCVLDLIGVAIAGTRAPMSRLAARFAFSQFGDGEATIIGSRRHSSATAAAFVNGTSASALDLDDGNRIAMGHPGSAVIPTALAIAELTEADGREFLAAVVAGYEIAVRTSVARVPWYKDRLYSTGIWGVFGAAAAAAKLLDLDERAFQSAFGNAASHGPFAPGGPEANYSMVKEVIGWANLTGCGAALLAMDGFVGPADVLDYSGRWDTACLVEALGDGSGYAILQTYFKPYAVCRWSHSAIDAVLDLITEHDLRAEEVLCVHVAAFYEATRLLERRPATVIAMQFSLPCALALALVHRRVGPEEVGEANLHDERMLALADKVEVTVDPELNARFPAQTVARVTIETARGTFEETVEYPRGSPERPFDETELLAKFHSLADPVVGRAQADQIEDAVLALPEAQDVKGLTALLSFDSL